MADGVEYQSRGHGVPCILICRDERPSARASAGNFRQVLILFDLCRVPTPLNETFLQFETKSANDIFLPRPSCDLDAGPKSVAVRGSRDRNGRKAEKRERPREFGQRDQNFGHRFGRADLDVGRYRQECRHRGNDKRVALIEHVEKPRNRETEKTLRRESAARTSRPDRAPRGPARDERAPDPHNRPVASAANRDAVRCSLVFSRRLRPTTDLSPLSLQRSARVAGRVQTGVGCSQPDRRSAGS